MQIKDLEYFVKLAELQNFTQVAQYFKVSQPTITYAIKRVEEALDGQLIQRDQSHHAISLTPDGAQFSAHAKHILNELQVARIEIKNNARAKIFLGLPPIIGNYYFPQYIPQLNQARLIQYLHTHSRGSEYLLSQLLAGELNLALLATSTQLDAQALKLIPLAQKSFGIIVSQQHPLAKRDSVAFSEIADEDFVALDEGFVHTAVFDVLTASSGHKPNIIYQTDDVNILKKMVSQNAGIALLTDLAVTPNDDVKLLRIKNDDLPSFKIYLAYRHDYILAPIEQQFVAIFTQKAH
ncbi:LysR family transcriptional regulator [Agrilactobacillus fermenti]|uniref:LysR family transcriptional regulator n=1 Tax=Agrilactobacillus fermenti TaxID=2586909 RepID=UPI001E4E36CA|nr:LysR family transcriptional regulator [Agrilactobacillus fermenti]MCD2256516.1 LysR family transcriptional regulator [Agrilactobacillus fermenti]